jgi:transketolase
MNSANGSKEIDKLCISTLRLLAVDMVEKAKSGHPGLPLGAAPLAYTIFDRVMRFNPHNPKWFNRDRFVLSAGHGSALLYSMLHLTGYDLSLDELMNFRQYESRTPGHPEYGETPGIEATTGPLGQGFAMGVGMAIAEQYLAARFNRDGFPVIDHYIYEIVSDGDLMEGVSAEAASLAGHLKLSKLIYLYDDNDISIDGNTRITFTEDVGKRFESYGWFVQRVADGNDIEAIEKAIFNAKIQTRKPSIIICKTHIGFGSPKQDTPGVHGEPLGAEAMKKTNEFFGWPSDAAFLIPNTALDHFRQAIPRGLKQESEWNELFSRYRQSHSELAAELEQVISGKLPDGWDSGIPKFEVSAGALATRDTCGKVMNAIAKKNLMFIGGSADLAASTKTDLKDCNDFSDENRSGRNLRFGIREHAMGSICNGIYLHGGIIPFTGTFLVFADYMRPAIRLAALMKTRVIFIFSHDSIGVGEDGPTHQPIEQIMSLRAIPHLTVFRPADANETSAAWKMALTLDGPSVMITSRQKLPTLDFARYKIFENFQRGGYIIVDSERKIPDIILIATGSEVSLILSAREKLLERGIDARVVSMPSCEIFDRQTEDYRHSVLLPDIAKLAVEAGSPMGWYKYIGGKGDVIGLERFGASAPGDVVMRELGFNIENVVARTMALIAGRD